MTAFIRMDSDAVGITLKHNNNGRIECRYTGPSSQQHDLYH